MTISPIGTRGLHSQIKKQTLDVRLCWKGRSLFLVDHIGITQIAALTVIPIRSPNFKRNRKKIKFEQQFFNLNLTAQLIEQTERFSICLQKASTNIKRSSRPFFLLLLAYNSSVQKLITSIPLNLVFKREFSLLLDLMYRSLKKKNLNACAVACCTKTRNCAERMSSLDATLRLCNASYLFCLINAYFIPP